MDFYKHPLCTHELAAPRGTEEQVSPLPIAALTDEMGVGLYSFWRPSPEELAMLNAGHAIVLGVHSPQHPVVSIGVTKEPA